jgi:hypothetical protein
LHDFGFESAGEVPAPPSPVIEAIGKGEPVKRHKAEQARDGLDLGRRGFGRSARTVFQIIELQRP